MASPLLLVNPRKRRKARKTTAKRRTTRRTTHKRRAPVARRRHNPIRRRRTAAHRVHHVRRRRNPARRKMGFFSPIMPAAIAAVGAIGLDLVWGYAPVPASWKAGTMGYAAKGVGALALGAVLGMFMKKSTAEALAAGALTVTIHGALKDGISSSMPNIQMGEIMPAGLGYMSPGVVVSDQPQMLTNQSTGAMGEITPEYATAGFGY